jgi:hypothetical protein
MWEAPSTSVVYMSIMTDGFLKFCQIFVSKIGKFCHFVTLKAIKPSKNRLAQIMIYTKRN